MSKLNLVVALVVAVATAGSMHQCPWGQCDDETATYMHLLQVHANSHRGEVTFTSSDDEDSSMLKKKYPYYHTSSEIHQKVKQLSRGCGNALTMETLSDSGSDIDVVRVKAPNSNPVNKVFILFGEHSRELISPESGLHLLEMLCGSVDMKGELSVSSILQDSEFQMVVNGNPQSRNRVEGGDYCLRTNPQGVDLNRNWDEKWTLTEEEEQNSGPKPFSEPETRIFKRLVEKYQPTTFLTVHSGTKGLYMPYAYDREHLAGFNAPLMLEVLKSLDKDHCQCPFGAAGKEVGYPCPGTCLDWVYDKLKTPYVFAFEIYTSPDADSELKRRWEEKLKEGGTQLLQSGNHLGHGHFAEIFDEFSSDFVQRRIGKQASAESERCFSLFNPKSELAYNTTVHNWAVAYLEMASMIAKDLKNNRTAAFY